MSRTALSPLLLSMRLLGAVPVTPRLAPRPLLQLGYSGILLLSLSRLTVSALARQLEKFREVAERDSGLATMEFMNTVIIGTLLGTLVLIATFLVLNGTFFEGVLNRLDEAAAEIRCDEQFISELRRYSWGRVSLFWTFFTVIVLQETLFWRTMLTMSLAETLALFLVRALHTVLELQMAALVKATCLLFHFLNDKIAGLTAQLHWQEVTSRLEGLRHAHSSLCQLTGEVSSSYQPVLLVSLSLLALDVLDSTYYALLSGVDLEASFKHQRAAVVVFATSWGAIVYLRFLHLTCTCQDAHVQRDMTHRAIQKLEFTTGNPHVLQELALFREELAHTAVRFDVFGATLGLPLLHAFHGGMTAYLVILLQFHTLNQQFN